MMAAGQASGPVDTVFASTGSSLMALNVSDTSSPTVISSHTVDLNAGSMAYSNKRKHVYCSSKSDGEIFSIDVSNTSFMSTSQTVTGLDEIFTLALDDFNDVLYTIDIQGDLKSWDVSTPSSISLLDEISLRGVSAGGDIALDLVRKRAIVAADNSATNYYELFVVDISNPSAMSELASKTNSTDEAATGYSSVALDQSRGYAFWFTEARSFIIDYSSDGTTQVFGNFVGRSAGVLNNRSYYRGRDNVLFTPDNKIYDASGDSLGTALDTIATEVNCHDDYRLVSFGLTNSATDKLSCFDTSDTSNATLLGEIADAALTYVGRAVSATSGPSATKAYGR